jgi:CMP-N-acetylneuraminic acid synthetase
LANPASLVAVIPARGGSKRLPGKNIQSFFGHPMLAYTIASALNSGLFERVVVSTDHSLIGRLAEWYGAEYLRRPAELATDEVGLANVGLHALESLAVQGIGADALCLLMPNCPLRRSKDIVEHYHIFKNSARSFQISVVPYRGVYPQWALVEDSEGRGRWLFGSKYLVPSQQLDVAYCPTGAVWWARVADFVAQRTFYGTPFYLAPINGNRGIDIDCFEELELADVLVQGLWKRDGVSPLEPIDKKPFSP